jgi:hypothetical protein
VGQCLEQIITPARLEWLTLRRSAIWESAGWNQASWPIRAVVSDQWQVASEHGQQEQWRVISGKWRASTTAADVKNTSALRLLHSSFDQTKTKTPRRERALGVATAGRSTRRFCVVEKNRGSKDPRYACLSHASQKTWCTCPDASLIGMRHPSESKEVLLAQPSGAKCVKMLHTPCNHFPVFLYMP